MSTTVAPTSDLDLYHVEVTLIGFRPAKRWRCRVYCEDQLLDSFELDGVSHDLADWQTKERAVAIAAGYVDIEPPKQRVRLTDAQLYTEVQGD